MTNRAPLATWVAAKKRRLALWLLLWFTLGFLAGLVSCAPALCTTDASCQAGRATLYDTEPLTEAQIDSLLQERAS